VVREEQGAERRQRVDARALEDVVDGACGHAGGGQHFDPRGRRALRQARLDLGAQLVAALLVVAAVVLLSLARGQRRALQEHLRGEEMHNQELERRLHGRSVIEADMSEFDETRSDQLALLGRPDLASAEALVRAEDEHVARIERLRAQLDYEPKRLVLTTPNVAFIVQRLMLLAGQFNYGKAGVLDRTHTRLFTFRAIEHLLRDAGFRIKVVKGVPAPFPKVLGNGVLGRAALNANLALIALSKTLFSYQIYIEAESTPDVDFVVSDAAKRSGVHHNVTPLRRRNAS